MHLYGESLQLHVGCPGMVTAVLALLGSHLVLGCAVDADGQEAPLGPEELAVWYREARVFGACTGGWDTLSQERGGDRAPCRKGRGQQEQQATGRMHVGGGRRPSGG